MGSLDFKEIASPEDFEDLVAEVLARLPGITHVRRSGRGTDAEVDIFATGRRQDSLLPPRDLSIIVQCKHLAESGKAVGKHDVSIMDALQIHNADIYLLVTSTRVGSFSSQVIASMQEDPRRRDQYAASWDSNDLERELLRPSNADLLQRYFPRSAPDILARKRTETALVTTSLQKTLEAHSLMPRITAQRPNSRRPRASASTSLHLALFPSEIAPVREAVIREQAAELSVRLSLTQDLPNSVLWSFENFTNYKHRLSNVESVIALVGPRAASAPGIWLELVAAQRAGKLRVVLIPEELYTVTKHGRLPCVLLGISEDESLASLVRQYRASRSAWGHGAEKVFWVLVALTLLWYQEQSSVQAEETLSA